MKNVVVIRATFIGRNSCGFQSGIDYTLEVQNWQNVGTVRIWNKYGKGYCEYGSFQAFLNNWDFTAHENKRKQEEFMNKAKNFAVLQNKLSTNLTVLMNIVAEKYSHMEIVKTSLQESADELKEMNQLIKSLLNDTIREGSKEAC